MKKVDYTLYFITNSDGYDEETFLNKVKGHVLDEQPLSSFVKRINQRWNIMNWQLKSKI